MSAGTTSHPYSRYLAAKRTVDDRALNRPVLDELRRLLPPHPPRVLEIGAGLGTMVARLLDWQVIGDDGEYTLLDVDPRLLEDSRAWLSAWAQARGVPARTLPDGVRLGGLRVRLVAAELGGYLRTGGAAPVDLLIANAVMDVVDVPSVLPPLLSLAPGGAYWFTVTFDGDSVFQPDHPCDDAVLGAYHRSMDGRVRHGRPAGESRAGRHLIGHLRAAGAPPRAAGSSDWVVLAGPDGSYPDDEAWFLECILRTIQDELDGPAAPAGLAGWLAARRRQLACGELVYIAHQLDVAGRSPA